MDERVREPAAGQLLEDRGDPADERIERGTSVVWRTSLDDVGGELDERGHAPVGRADRHQLVDATDPHDLQVDERVEHRFELGEVGVVAVVAGHVGEEHPPWLAGDDPRHRRAGSERTGSEQREHRGLVREERGHVLQPHESSVGGDPPDRREVPRAHLHRFAGDRDVTRGPVEIGVRTTGHAYGRRSGSSRTVPSHGCSTGVGSPRFSSAR